MTSQTIGGNTTPLLSFLGVAFLLIIIFVIRDRCWMIIPFTGLYYFSWTGTNGEYLTRPKKVDANSTTIYAKLQFRRSLNELLGWAEESTKTHIVIQLMKGWEVRMGVMLEDGLWSKGQYEKFVAYFLG